MKFFTQTLTTSRVCGSFYVFCGGRLQVSLFIIYLEEPIYREELIKKNKNVVLLLSQAEHSCGNND